MVNTRFRVFITFLCLFTTLIVPAAAAEQAHITEIYANGDICEVNIEFFEDSHNVTLRYDLMYRDQLIDSKVVKLGNVTTGNITKITLWNNNLKKQIYTFKVTVFVDRELADSRQTLFVYGNEALMDFKVAGFRSNNKGSMVVLSPTNIYHPSVVDLSFEIFKEDELLYSETLEDVSVVQSLEKTIKWPILLDKGKKYITVLKIYSHVSNLTSAYVSIFKAEEDVKIMPDDLEIDEYGASVTLRGMSQVPFEGKVSIALINDARYIYFEEECDLLTLNKEDTIGFLWESIPPGEYIVEISAINNEGKTIDSYQTAVRIREIATFQQEQTKELPGLNIVSNIIVFMTVFLLIRINRGIDD
jgi:hypothetical protein